MLDQPTINSGERSAFQAAHRDDAGGVDQGGALAHHVVDKVSFRSVRWID
jgi:hypothetical protein